MRTSTAGDVAGEITGPGVANAEPELMSLRVAGRSPVHRVRVGRGHGK